MAGWTNDLNLWIVRNAANSTSFLLAFCSFLPSFLAFSLLPEKVKAGGAAVLSCPAYFSDVQRDVMAAAGGDAGIVVLDTIDEPVVREKQ